MSSATGMLQGFIPSRPLDLYTRGSTQSSASHRNRQTGAGSGVRQRLALIPATVCSGVLNGRWVEVVGSCRFFVLLFRGA